YTDPVTQLTFEGIERPLDMDHPEGDGLRFPGLLDGKVVATREAYFVVTDNDPLDGNTIESNGIGPLNVRIDMWGLQYSDILNQDFIIWWQKFTNVGSDTLYEVFVGLAGDPDIPEQGGAEWTDDYSVFIQRGDPHIAEKLADTTDARLLWDLAIIWDGDDKAEGLVSSGLAWIGLKALKTPNTQTADGIDNDLDGITDEGFDGFDNDGDGEIDEEDEQEEMGVTNYFAYPYDFDAGSDNDAYFNQIRAGFGEDSDVTGYQEAPHDDDIWQKPYAYGPDITIVMTSGPFKMAPGQSLEFVFADIIGVSELDVLTNARTAQRLFNAGFKASAPPDEPIVHGVAADRKITLYWDAFPSEFSIDPNTGNNTFQGYRIYKSTDRGATWGNPITDGRGNVVFFKPQVIYDLQDDISGLFAYGSPEVYYDLGGNSGLQYSYTDENVMNGVEYWYAVSAYDSQDGIVPPLENAPKKSRIDALTSGNNTVILIPQARQTGWEDGMIELQHLEGFSTAELLFNVYDPAEFSGYDYLLTITDDMDSMDDTTKSFSVLNNNIFTVSTEISKSGTKLPHRNIMEGSVIVTSPANEEFMEDVDYAIDITTGKIYALEDTASVSPQALEKGTAYTVSYKYYPIFESSILAGEASNPSFQGIRLLVTDWDDIDQDQEKTYWYNPDNPDSKAETNWILTAAPFLAGKGNPDDYEIRLSDTDSTAVIAPPGAKLPLTIWNITDNVQIEKVAANPTAQPGETVVPIVDGLELMIFEVPNWQTNQTITWKFKLQSPEPASLDSSEQTFVICDTTRGNSQYDGGEPYNDFGTDGLPSELEPGYDADENPDPSGDDYDADNNPNGTEGNGEYEEGEPYVDCYADTSSGINQLSDQINTFVTNMTQTLIDSLPCLFTPTELETTYSDIIPWPFFDEITLEFDSLWVLTVEISATVLCDTSVSPVVGDIVRIGTTKPLTTDDVYLIQTSASKATLTTKKQLKNIKVVPNPYIVTSAPEQNIEIKEVQFHNLPEACTIRIFTIAGELVRVIEHRENSSGWRGPSIEAWDLRSYNEQEIAFGIYIFHVEAKEASKTFSTTGKFAIIR
ncbi:MAG: hypothetical protein IID16_11290, partial [Candidatus Marinimicrobia bacterium]|nr:hypothetical protein [Candidatus Neomarinimicrobiota bacterium]